MTPDVSEKNHGFEKRVKNEGSAEREDGTNIEPFCDRSQASNSQQDTARNQIVSGGTLCHL